MRMADECMSLVRITVVRTAVALCLLILYLLSVGPAIYFGMDRNVTFKIFMSVYGPAGAVEESSAHYRHYINWWQRKRSQVLVAEYRRAQLESQGLGTGSR